MTATRTGQDLTAGAEAVALTRDALVFDCLSLYYTLDSPYTERILEGGVNVCNVTFSAEADWETTLRNIELGLERVEKSPIMMQVLSAEDARKAKAEGKLGIILGTQGASMVQDKLWRVGLLARLGCRIIGLAYTQGNLLADGCGELRDAGLTFLGREFVDAVNEQPMLLDLSHSGHRARAEATERARAPVCTHSNPWHAVQNDRNTKDETAEAIVAKGGMVGACALPTTVKAKDATLGDLLDHVGHWSRLVGAENVGLGFDFVEAYKESGVVLAESQRWRTLRPDIFGTVDDFLHQDYPKGIEHIRLLPNVTQGLMDRQYGRQEIEGILGGNWLRTFEKLVG
jgi:membrane dipeptidase